MPTTKSRLGFYYSPDDRHYSQSALSVILPALESVGAGWLILKASSARAIPEEFLGTLLSNGIQPVVHMPIRVGEASAQDLRSLIAAYARWGVKHVIVFDRPNQKSSWPEGHWNRANLVERFADHLIPVLELQAEAGLCPIVPALEPGGDYWDLAFLDTLLPILEQRLTPPIKDQIKLAIYGWVNEKPLDWGSGGPNAWPDTRPYHTPPGAQDHLGFRIFEWYASVTQKVFSRALPMLVVAGGSMVHSPNSIVGGNHNLEANVAIARMLHDESLPSYLENFSFYYLYDPDSSIADKAGWISSQAEQQTALNTLIRLAQQGGSKAAPNDSKRYSHYLLLPAHNQHHAMLAWAEIGPYVIERRPLVGFSIDEAKCAQRVTLAGDESVIPPSVVAELSAAGCKVDRLETPIHYQYAGSSFSTSLHGASQE